MLKTIRLTALSLLALAWSASALSREVPAEIRSFCEQRLPSSEVVFVPVIPQVEVTNDKTLAQLAQMRGENRDEAVLGLTEVRFDGNAQWAASMLRFEKHGISCARFQAKLELKVAPHRVYVAKELQPQTCSHKTVLEHELEHVALNEAHALAVAQSFNQKVAELNNQVWYGSREEIEKAVDAYLKNAWLDPAVQALRSVSHASLDSAAYYDSNRTACSQEVLRIVESATRSRW